MNSLIFQIALLLEGLFHQARRLGFGLVFAGLAVGAPVLLLAYAGIRYGDAAARAHLVVLGCEQIVVALLAALVLRAAVALLFDLAATRLYRQASGDDSAAA
jgi:hypothetical protein